jgi:hypothetical protein
MVARPSDEILFVYNVDLTLFALVSDFVHRLTSPETYPCRLCDLTYDRLTVKREWKRFVDSLSVRPRVQLRDRFHKRFPAQAAVPLPAVFRLHADGAVTMLLTADEINRATTLDELKALVSRAIHSRSST